MTIKKSFPVNIGLSTVTDHSLNRNNHIILAVPRKVTGQLAVIYLSNAIFCYIW